MYMFAKTLLVIVLLISTPAWSQQQPPAGASGQSDVVSKYGPRRQIATIVYMGLAGAVLGLSTLSFYGRPQDKLSNIPLGFGVGVVIGTIYMTYQAATNPQDFYRAEYKYEPDWKSRQDLDVTSATDIFIQPEQPSVGYTWSF